MFRFFEKVEMENGKKIPLRKISHFVAKGKIGKRWTEIARSKEPIDPEDIEIPEEVTTVKVYCYTKDGKKYTYRTYYNQPDIQPQIIETPPQQPQASNIREALAPVLAQLQTINELREVLKDISESINPQPKMTDIVKELSEHFRMYRELQESIMGVTKMFPQQQQNMPWFVQLFIDPVYREALKDTILDIVGELKGGVSEKKEEVSLYVPRPKVRRKVQKSGKSVGRDAIRREEERDTEVHREPEREESSENITSTEGHGDSIESDSDVHTHDTTRIQEHDSQVSVGTSDIHSEPEGEIDDSLELRASQIKEILKTSVESEDKREGN